MAPKVHLSLTCQVLEAVQKQHDALKNADTLQTFLLRCSLCILFSCCVQCYYPIKKLSSSQQYSAVNFQNCLLTQHEGETLKCLAEQVQRERCKLFALICMQDILNDFRDANSLISALKNLTGGVDICLLVNLQKVVLADYGASCRLSWLGAKTFPAMLMPQAVLVACAALFKASQCCQSTSLWGDETAIGCPVTSLCCLCNAAS